MLWPGFEPGSKAREAFMLGRTTPPERGLGLTGFEPAAIRLRVECSDQAELQTRQSNSVKFDSCLKRLPSLVDDIKDGTQHTRKMASRVTQLLDVPFFQKIQEGYCGPASLQMIFAYHGMPSTQEEIADSLCPTIVGVKRDHIERYARLRGFQVQRERTLGIERLLHAIDSGIPPLLLGNQHAFVVCGYTLACEKLNSVLIHDPNYALGNQEITPRTLDWLWRRHTNDKEETDALLITR